METGVGGVMLAVFMLSQDHFPLEDDGVETKSMKCCLCAGIVTVTVVSTLMCVHRQYFWSYIHEMSWKLRAKDFLTPVL